MYVFFLLLLSRLMTPTSLTVVLSLIIFYFKTKCKRWQKFISGSVSFASCCSFILQTDQTLITINLKLKFSFRFIYSVSLGLQTVALLLQLIVCGCSLPKGFLTNLCPIKVFFINVSLFPVNSGKWLVAWDIMTLIYPEITWVWGDDTWITFPDSPWMTASIFCICLCFQSVVWTMFLIHRSSWRKKTSFNC